MESVSCAGSETPKRRSVLNKEAKRLLSHYLIFRGSKLTICWLSVVLISNRELIGSTNHKVVFYL